MPAYYRILSLPRGYQFELFASNGDRILSGEYYATEPLCRESINHLKHQCGFAHHFHRHDIPGGKFGFTVSDRHDQILATSESFWSSSSRDYAMQIVRRECPEASIKVMDKPV